eukprot:CAMPEP_0119322400 /NCGR_PEP_ID=MMETSP1333-20130426/58092_1 /TAXON_ID=418940 /ORGANISM="Scyphosphaera apsteinii, Strain RCC1455" /LENGTH=51 /DNA_ID=CAMNT_0007329627 /DNA_START=79 /DNA_END=234 /DNA_ORIENTATION=-
MTSVVLSMERKMRTLLTVALVNHHNELLNLADELFGLSRELLFSLFRFVAP